MTLLGCFSKVSATEPNIVTIYAIGEGLRFASSAIAFVLDACGKVYGIVSHNSDIDRLDAEKREFGGRRSLLEVRRMLLDITNGMSIPAVYGQSLAKQQCFESVAGYMANMVATGMEKPGNIIYMIGPSGTGKTTMAKAIANAFLRNAEKTMIIVDQGSVTKDKELGTQLFKTVTEVKNLLPGAKRVGIWETISRVCSRSSSSDPMSGMGSFEITVASRILSHILRWGGQVVVIIDEYDKMKRTCSTRGYDGEMVEDKSADEILKSIASNGYYMVGSTKVDCSDVLFIVTTNETREELEASFGQRGVVGGGAQRLNIIEFNRLDDEAIRRIINDMLKVATDTLTDPSGEFKIKNIRFSEQTILNMIQYIRENEVKQARAKTGLWNGLFGVCTKDLDKLQHKDVELIFNENKTFSYQIIETADDSGHRNVSLELVDFSSHDDVMHDFADSDLLMDHSSVV